MIYDHLLTLDIEVPALRILPFWYLFNVGLGTGRTHMEAKV